MEQIQINHTKIFGDIDMMFTYLLEMQLPVKMRLATATGTKIRLATDVIEVSLTAIDSNSPGAVAGITFYYPPRAPVDAPLQMRFYLNAAREHQCIEWRVPPHSHRAMAVLVAWWFLTSTYAPNVRTDVATLFKQDNMPPVRNEERNEIRTFVQLLDAYISGERQKQKEVA
jgi:hypothetical protein